MSGAASSLGCNISQRLGLPKGIDPSDDSQRDRVPATKHLLCADIAAALNDQPRAALGCRTLREGFDNEIQNARVALQL